MALNFFQCHVEDETELSQMSNNGELLTKIR